MKAGEYYLSKMSDGTTYHIQSVFTVESNGKEHNTIYAHDVGREHLGWLRIPEERLLKKVPFQFALKQFIEVKALYGNAKLDKMLNDFKKKYVE